MFIQSKSIGYLSISLSALQLPFNVLYFSAHKFFTPLVKFIPTYVIFLDVIIKRIVFVSFLLLLLSKKYLLSV